MLPSRFAAALPSSGMRKSRFDGKQSLLPRPRNAGSMDRLSADVRRPSTARSSSADQNRATMASGRVSREASASKTGFNKRSQSQHAREQHAARSTSCMMTPRNKMSYARATTTPVRTPSEDRKNRNWQTSLDRALAFVTVKDQRPLSDASWVRSLYHRVQESLAGSRGARTPLIRPLTITRFVEITRDLLTVIIKDPKLNNDNYVAKIPHIAKRLLYPGTVNKSWLQTVNTLHAFPHALAFIAYLLDLANCIERPISDERLYADNDELSVLRREFILKSYLSFQGPEHNSEELIQEYVEQLALLFGDDDAKIAQLKETNRELERCLEDEAAREARDALRAAEDRNEELRRALRCTRAARHATRAQLAAARERIADCNLELKNRERAIERAVVELDQVNAELEQQTMSVEERDRQCEEIDYLTRVHDSKLELIDQISKMVSSKETELAHWQKVTLDICVSYQQGLIHLSAQYPDLAAFAIQEKQLMGPSCLATVSAAVDELRARVAELNAQLAHIQAARGKEARERGDHIERARADLSRYSGEVSRVQQWLEAARAREEAAASAWERDERDVTRALHDARERIERADVVARELTAWEQQEQLWCSKLSALREYVARSRADSQRLLHEQKKDRADRVCDTLNHWKDVLDSK